MAYKKTYDQDPTRKRFIAQSGDTKPTSNVATFGDFLFLTDSQILQIFSSTGGWVNWRNFST